MCGMDLNTNINTDFGTVVAANLYFREYVPMGIESLRFHSESIPMGTF